MEQNKSVAQPTEKRMRWSDEELTLMSSMFFNDERFLNIFRMFLFQTEISLDEWIELKKKADATPEAFNLLKKAIHPEIDPRYAPMFQLVDLWYNVETKDRDADASFGFILARSKIVKYFDYLFDTLQNHSINEVPDHSQAIDEVRFDKLLNFDFETDDKDSIFARVHARKVILDHVDSQLNQISVLSARKAKTPEQIEADAKKNSTK
jgi:hypothetical protein